MLENFDYKETALLLEDNMVEKFLYLSKLSLSTITVVDNKDIVVINSNQLSDMFNIICRIRTADLSVIKRSIDCFKKNNLPFALWTGFKGEPKNLKQMIEELGLVCTENELGMSISSERIKKLPCAFDKCKQLKIVIVDESKTLDDFIKVYSKLIPQDARSIKKFLALNSSFLTNLFLYVISKMWGKKYGENKTNNNFNNPILFNN